MAHGPVRRSASPAPHHLKSGSLSPEQPQHPALLPSSSPRTCPAESRGLEQRVRGVFEHLADRKGCITPVQLSVLLQRVRLRISADTLQGYVQATAADDGKLTLQETLSVVAAVASQQGIPSTPGSPMQSLQLPMQASMSQASSINMGGSLRALSQRRSYMDSGWLCQDQVRRRKLQPVRSYMKKLELHRKKCEQEGKYLEARAASLRLAELKAKEAQRMRAAILQRQETEIALAKAAFQKEKVRLEALWQQRKDEYSAAVETQVQKLSEKHAAQLDAFHYAIEMRRPCRPKYSRDLLNQRKVMEVLARQGMYSKAAAVQGAANAMEAAEMRATTAAFEAEAELKEAKLHARQTQEMAVLRSRGDRGQDELKRAHQQDLERREQRLRNLEAELINLQRLEVVHLESFLDGQARAGKQRPLEGSGFRREGSIEYDLIGT